ncbi:hypothetical protein KW460_21655 [Vibrio fluvialis]|nr:hypothetical protein [Vibrio fluvialis]MBY7839640.1 hypothetical protein [Vibrio fluvialis]
MASLEIYNPQETKYLTSSMSLEPLHHSRPATRVRFVRQGDTFHLLVYLHTDAGTPFLHVPAEHLYHAANAFVKAQMLSRSS